MNIRTQNSYVKRLDRVLDYLAAHLDESLDLNRLAEEACLSPYHFHRIYVAITGESVSDTVRRLRLRRATAHLLTTDMPLPQIAKAAGYGSVQAFNRAFRSAYNVSPAKYRKSGGIALLNANKHLEKESAMYDVTIENVEPQSVLALRHEGDYCNIDYAFERLLNLVTAKNYIGCECRVFGVYHDDPTIVKTDELRSDACITVTRAVDEAEPFHMTETPAGRCAVLEHVGPFAEIDKAYDWVMGTWLPEHNEEPADKPVFMEHLNNPRNTTPDALRTKLYVPLK